MPTLLKQPTETIAWIRGIEGDKTDIIVCYLPDSHVPPMSDTDPQPNNPITASPLRCFFGATLAASLAYFLYWLTTNIAQTFAAKPVVSSNVITLNIAIAVRTLVVGVSTFATFIFALATLGLIALGIQMTIKSFSKES